MDRIAAKGDGNDWEERIDRIDRIAAKGDGNDWEDRTDRITADGQDSGERRRQRLGGKDRQDNGGWTG
jgi:hypothetical protein